MNSAAAAGKDTDPARKPQAAPDPIRKAAAMRITIEDATTDPDALAEVVMPDGKTYTIDQQSNLEPLMSEIGYKVRDFRLQMAERAPLSHNDTPVPAEERDAAVAEFEYPMLIGIAVLAVQRELFEIP